MTSVKKDCLHDAAVTHQREKAKAVRLIDLGPQMVPARVRIFQEFRWLLRIASPLAILLLWQVSSFTGLLSERILPSPLGVVQGFADVLRTGELQDALGISMWRAMSGLSIGALVGISLGLISGLKRLGDELLDPPLQMLRTIPFLALTPLFMAWFGIGEQAKIAFVAAACVFPNYINTYSGVRAVDVKIIEAGRTFGLSGARLTLQLVLPMALPQVLMGLRYSLGTSFLALVAAEQINASSGIGYLLINANNIQRMDILVAGIVVYSILGLLIDTIIRIAERILLPWRSTLHAPASR